MSFSDQATIQRFQAARRDPDLVVLEGFHALKHAHRFGAETLEVVASEPERVKKLVQALAPDCADFFDEHLVEVAAKTLAQLAPVAHHSGVMGIARRRHYDLDSLEKRAQKFRVVLYNPQHYGNIGAVIRVAAAAGAAGVVVVGDHDPWQPEAVRGAAGLQFALPVLRLDELPTNAGPLVAVDPEGDEAGEVIMPPGAWLLFGTERYGLPKNVSQRADIRVRIPMEPGVSSLNLATSVAIMLYAQRLV